MQAGKLRLPVTVTRYSTTKNKHNQSKKDFNSIGQLWAGITPLAGRELENAQAIESQMSHKITVRAEFQILAKDRVEFGDRVFNIASVGDVNERNRQLDLLCVEVTTNG